MGWFTAEEIYLWGGMGGGMMGKKGLWWIYELSMGIRLVRVYRGGKKIIKGRW